MPASSGFPISANVKTEGIPFRISIISLSVHGISAKTGSASFQTGEIYEIIFNLSVLGTQINERIEVDNVSEREFGKTAECSFVELSSEGELAIAAYSKLHGMDLF